MKFLSGNLEALRNSFAILNDEELNLIKGGDPDPGGGVVEDDDIWQ
jgi:bacteriocin-like protein